jgi:elongation factor 1 alpha-like protein
VPSSLTLRTQVRWEKDRYDEICHVLAPFLVQSGFHPQKTKFIPVGAIMGVNLVNRDGEDAKVLNGWYNGPTLVDLLGDA